MHLFSLSFEAAVAKLSMFMLVLFTFICNIQFHWKVVRYYSFFSSYLSVLIYSSAALADVGHLKYGLFQLLLGFKDLLTYGTMLNKYCETMLKDRIQERNVMTLYYNII